MLIDCLRICFQSGNKRNAFRELDGNLVNLDFKDKEMETLNKDIVSIQILNPEVKSLLESLATLKYIKIRDDGTKELKKLLDKIRNNSQEEISLEEITKEVEIVRKDRYY